MSNMSYVRFENTLADLRDCRDALLDICDDDEEMENLSDTEISAAIKLIDLCANIVDAHAYDTSDRLLRFAQDRAQK